MRGGMSRRMLRNLQKGFASVSKNEARLLLAIGKFLGEVSDDSCLDTLFLTMPISWKGTLALYAGRLHRLYDRKTEVIIYDYADLNIRITSKIFERRVAGYKSTGDRIISSNELFNHEIFSEEIHLPQNNQSTDY